MARVTLWTEKTYGLNTKALTNTSRRQWCFSKNYKTQRLVAVSMTACLVILPHFHSYNVKKDAADWKQLSEIGLRVATYGCTDLPMVS
jgi:hypothetical protein